MRQLHTGGMPGGRLQHLRYSRSAAAAVAVRSPALSAEASTFSSAYLSQHKLGSTVGRVTALLQPSTAAAARSAGEASTSGRTSPELVRGTAASNPGIACLWRSSFLVHCCLMAGLDMSMPRSREVSATFHREGAFGEEPDRATGAGGRPGTAQLQGQAAVGWPPARAPQPSRLHQREHPCLHLVKDRA